MPASTLNHTNNQVKKLNSGVYTSNMAIYAKIRIPKRMRWLCGASELVVPAQASVWFSFFFFKLPADCGHHGDSKDLKELHCHWQEDE